MTKYCKTFFVFCCQNVQFAVFFKNCTKIYNLTVYFTCTCCACKTFTDVISNIDYGFCFCVFSLRTVF